MEHEQVLIPAIMPQLGRTMRSLISLGCIMRLVADLHRGACIRAGRGRYVVYRDAKAKSSQAVLWHGWCWYYDQLVGRGRSKHSIGGS